MNYQPLMKWSGSKRSQSFDICSKIAGVHGTYYEPFLGGGSVMFRLMRENCGRFEKFVGSDINADLISVYNEVKDNPSSIMAAYRSHYTALAEMDIEDRKNYFCEVRSRFNDSRNPCDFFWIMRTTTNGMPRYNADGKFNNSFHVTRIGMKPDSVDAIIMDYSKLFNSSNVEFRCCPYDSIVPEKGDFAYFDPPYAGTNGMYYGGIDTDALFGYLGKLKCGWMLSFDGKAGNDDLTYNVPEYIYDSHEYLKSGNSSFRRVIGKDKCCVVYESLYFKGVK